MSFDVCLVAIRCRRRLRVMVVEFKPTPPPSCRDRKKTSTSVVFFESVVAAASELDIDCRFAPADIDGWRDILCRRMSDPAILL